MTDISAIVNTFEPIVWQVLCQIHLIYVQRRHYSDVSLIQQYPNTLIQFSQLLNIQFLQKYLISFWGIFYNFFTINLQFWWIIFLIITRLFFVKCYNLAIRHFKKYQIYNCIFACTLTVFDLT